MYISNRENSKISIVIPVMNEEGNIGLLIEQISKLLADYDYEIIVVDDFSSDTTLKIVEQISKINKNVYYISLSRNFGHQAALKAGLTHARGGCVISMDGDLQHPPEIIPTMISHWISGYDIVYTLRKEGGDVDLSKKLSSSLFYKIMNYFSEVSIENGSADFRLLDIKIVKILIEEINDYHLFYRGLVNWVGFKKIGVSYIPSNRHSGKTKYSFKKMISFALNGVTSFSIKPLRLSILCGFICCISSAIYGLYALYIYFFLGTTSPGWTSILLTVLFIGGIQMMLLGIIGEYIGKIFIQVKNRPHFLISKTNISNE